MLKIKTIPECAGYWAPCVTCDGGLNSETRENEEPCSWRNKCKQIQGHMKTLNLDPQSYQNRYGGPDSLLRLIQRLETGKPVKIKTRPRKRGRRISPKTLREKRYKPWHLEAKKFLAIFKQVVYCPQLNYVERRTAAVSRGRLWLQDKSEAKQPYYSIYLVRGFDKDYRLATIRLAPVNRGLVVQLRNERRPEGLPNDVDWRVWDDHPLKSVVKTLKTEEHYEWMALELKKHALLVLEQQPIPTKSKSKP